MIRFRFDCLAVLLVGNALHTGRQAQPANTRSVLRPIDSVRIAENDSLLLSRPTHMVAGPRGHYFVADADEARVIEIAPSGQVVRVFGRRGRGPGELQTPGSIAESGDSLLAVMDNGQRRVVLYNLRTGTYQGSFVLNGWIPTLSFSGSALLAGVLQVDSGTALVRLSPTGERLEAQRAWSLP